MGRITMLGLACSMLLGTAAGAGAADLTLPKDLQWCQTLPEVANLLGINDTSEEGNSYRADGVYLVTGELWGHDGNWTVRLLEFGDQFFLTEAEFRMFRDVEEWAQIVERLNKELGAGKTDVVSSAVTDGDGNVVQSGRSKYSWEDPDGAWTVMARQMSNEIDAVKFTYHDSGACKPEVVDEGALDLSGTDTIPKSESREDTIFDYDPYAEDPLHADEGAKKKEEEEQREAEEKKKQQEQTDVDWDAGEDIDWDEDD